MKGRVVYTVVGEMRLTGFVVCSHEKKKCNANDCGALQTHSVTLVIGRYHLITHAFQCLPLPML